MQESEFDNLGYLPSHRSHDPPQPGQRNGVSNLWLAEEPLMEISLDTAAGCDNKVSLVHKETAMTVRRWCRLQATRDLPQNPLMGPQKWDPDTALNCLVPLAYRRH